MTTRAVLAGAIVAAAGLLAAGCSTGQPTPTVTVTVTRTVAPRPSAATPKPAALPVLRPGHSATFKAAPEVSGPAVTMTWTMGSGSVVRVPDNSLGKRGFEDV